MIETQRCLTGVLVDNVAAFGNLQLRSPVLVFYELDYAHDPPLHLAQIGSLYALHCTANMKACLLWFLRFFVFVR